MRVHGLSEGLCEHVGTVVFGGAVADFNSAEVDPLTDEVVPDVDVLRARMKLIVVHEGDSGLIIHEEERLSIRDDAEFGAPYGSWLMHHSMDWPIMGHAIFMDRLIAMTV